MRMKKYKDEAEKFIDEVIDETFRSSGDLKIFDIPAVRSLMRNTIIVAFRKLKKGND